MTPPSEKEPGGLEEPTLFQLSRRAIGFAFAGSFVVFLIAFAIVAVVSGLNWQAILGIAPGIAIIVLIAWLILGLRDVVSGYYLRRHIRKMLLTAGDATEEEFSQSFPDVPAELMREVRESIAHFFNVPLRCIRAHHHLVNVLQLPRFSPQLGFFAIGRALVSRGITTPVQLTWSMYVKDFGDFAGQIDQAITTARDAEEKLSQSHSKDLEAHDRDEHS